MARKNIRTPISLSAPVVAAMVGRKPRTVREWFSSGILESKVGESLSGQPCRVTTMKQLSDFCRGRGLEIAK
jgi:hypothetical protein